MAHPINLQGVIYPDFYPFNIHNFFLSCSIDLKATNLCTKGWGKRESKENIYF